MLTIEPTPSVDEATAIMAAIGCCLEIVVDDPDGAATNPNWSGSRLLIQQGGAARRPYTAPSWRNIERLQRAGRGLTGIVGL
ncbi:MAG: hypothetical protein HC837_02755 [Chloroflexaceae bacterium]|nr:hypothetical protein [Chloroflexaceae bacterium]